MLSKEERLREIAKKVVRWDDKFFPDIDMSRLISVMSARNPETAAYKSLIAEMIHYGVLTRSPEGNHDVRLKRQNFSMNPVVGEERLYWVSRDHANGFFRQLCLPNLEVITSGEFVIPGSIDRSDWARIRLKSLDTPKRIVGELMSREILTPHKTEGYRVVLQEERKTPLDVSLKFDSKPYYFKREDDAKEYAYAFRQRMRVVENKAALF